MQLGLYQLCAQICSVCKHIIGQDPLGFSQSIQVEEFIKRENPYRICCCCGRGISDWDDERYKARWNKWIQKLIRERAKRNP